MTIEVTSRRSIASFAWKLALLWGVLGVGGVAGPAEFAVKPIITPPEAQFQVRLPSGLGVPGGPDPRASLPSGTEFLARAENAPQTLVVSIVHPGYRNYQRTFTLSRGGDYWNEGLQGWLLPIELTPLGVGKTLLHQFRFHPLPAWTGLIAVAALLSLPVHLYLRRVRRLQAELHAAEEEAVRLRALEWKEMHDPDLIGREIGDYLVVRKLGEGGFARVFLVMHREYGDMFALKILRPHRADQETLKRLQRETEIGAKFNHPNLVRVVSYGDYQGVPYLVMDYLQGEDLTSILERGRLPREQALQVFRSICEGVQHAHSLGVLHRDLKPDNLFVSQDGPLKILDFGVARPMNEHSSLTQTGQSLGTPAYMAPEQLLGNPDLRSDIYSLGVILYLLLAGRLPFAHKEASEVLSAHLTEKPPSLTLFVEDLQPELERLCLKMLEKSPGRRVASVRDVLAELDRLGL